MWVKATHKNLVVAVVIFLQLLIIGIVTLFQDGREIIKNILALRYNTVSFGLLIEIITVIILILFIIIALIGTDNVLLDRIIAYLFCIWFSGLGTLFLFYDSTGPDLLSYFVLFGAILVLLIIITVGRINKRTEMIYLSTEKPSSEIYWMIHDLLKQNGIKYILRGTNKTLDFKLNILNRHISKIRFFPGEYQKKIKEQHIEYIVFDENESLFHLNVKRILYDAFKAYENNK